MSNLGMAKTLQLRMPNIWVRNEREEQDSSSSWASIFTKI